MISAGIGQVCALAHAGCQPVLNCFPGKAAGHARARLLGDGHGQSQLAGAGDFTRRAGDAGSGRGDFHDRAEGAVQPAAGGGAGNDHRGFAMGTVGARKAPAP